MSVVSPAAFHRLLGSLERAELEAFVADLWDARGWETTRQDGVVVARGGPADERQRLVCVTGTPADGGDPVPAALDPDVVVSATDGERVGAAARSLDARFVGPDDLRAMVLYGLDRAAAGALFEAHFGRSLAASAPSGTRRRTGAFLARTPVGPAVIAAAVVLAALAVAAGLAGGPGGSGAEVMSTPAPLAGTTPGGGAAASDGYPPGLDPTGVTDADAMAAAHGRAVADRTYDLLVVHRGSVDLLAPERTWAASRQTVERAGATRFHYRVAGVDADGDDRSLVVYDEYADGTATYRRIAGAPAATFRRAPLPGADGGAFTALGEAYVGRFLATSESRVEAVGGPNRTRYRVVATGSPMRIGRPVANYTAVAVVGRDGLVHRLTVEYVRLDPARPAGGDPADARDRYAGLDDGVRFELVYRDLDETDPPAPPWYDEARRATDETVLLRPPESLWWTQPIGIDYDDQA